MTSQLETRNQMRMLLLKRAEIKRDLLKMMEEDPLIKVLTTRKRDQRLLQENQLKLEENQRVESIKKENIELKQKISMMHYTINIQKFMIEDFEKKISFGAKRPIIRKRRASC
jgi:hypothetical protein